MDTDRRRRGIAGCVVLFVGETNVSKLSCPASARFRRGDDGRFCDNDIAGILQTATESIAGAQRGRGVAPCMRIMEMEIMQQAREWNVCSLNEFRRFLGLMRSSIINHIASLLTKSK